MAISRHLVELHGGTIRAQAPGDLRAARFESLFQSLSNSETLRRGVGESKSNSRAAEWTVPNLSGLSVLVVDDHSDARMLVERMLEGSGAEIPLAASAKRALDICKRQKIDILISDLGMPDMDGLEMIRQMRALEDGRSLMTIAVTAFAHLEDRQAALRQGFDFLATKPLDAGELMLLVGKCVSRLRRRIQNLRLGACLARRSVTRGGKRYLLFFCSSLVWQVLIVICCDLRRRSSKKGEQYPFTGYTAQAARLIREVYARNKAVYKKHVKRTHCPTRHRIIGGILVFPRFPVLQSEYLRWLSENLHDIFHFLSRQH